MTTKLKAHTGPHQYRRVKMGKDKSYVVFRCIIAGCSHYVPKELVVGKESICWKCNKPFVITSKNLHEAKPKCGCTSFQAERLAGIDVEALIKEGGKH